MNLIFHHTRLNCGNIFNNVSVVIIIAYFGAENCTLLRHYCLAKKDTSVNLHSSLSVCMFSPCMFRISLCMLSIHKHVELNGDLNWSQHVCLCCLSYVFVCVSPVMACLGCMQVPCHKIYQCHTTIFEKWYEREKKSTTLTVFFKCNWNHNEQHMNLKSYFVFNFFFLGGNMQNHFVLAINCTLLFTWSFYKCRKAE